MNCNQKNSCRVAAAAVVVLLAAILPAAASAADYVPGRLVVGTRPPVVSAAADIRNATGLPFSTRDGSGSLGSEQLLQVPAGKTVMAAAAAAREVPGITYAVPDYIAHAAGGWYPNDPGRAHRRRGWENLQWNFLSPAGVNAPQAWANLIADHHAGAGGIKVAVLDSGVAYRRWRQFREPSDFRHTKFVAPCDLVDGRLAHGRCTDPYALDRNGHGTFVTAEIAQDTNNGTGLTGLAYRASIMPVRVLNASGDGDSATVAHGIRYAVQHGARVINLSLQFGEGLTASDIPNVVSALQYANAHKVVVVAAAGNDGSRQVAYPARDRTVIAVGASTKDRCLAYYSDRGQGLDLVAPGGGDDASGLQDPNCHPNRNLPDIFQVAFRRIGHPKSFGIPGYWFGTSMAAPEASAAAAMVIASRVIGRHPTPAAVLTRLEQTATPLGTGQPDSTYGYGLLNIGAATSRTS